VLLSFVAARFGIAWADAAGAAVVLVIIGRTAWVVLRDSGEVFSDTARLDPVLVRKLVLSIDGVRGCHSIRSRGSRDHIHVDMHLLADPFPDAHASAQAQFQPTNRLGEAFAHQHYLGRGAAGFGRW